MEHASYFIARKLRFKGRIAVVCISVSFLVMIIAVAVSSGFRHEIRDGLSEMAGDVQVVPVNMDHLGGTSPIDRHPDYINDIVSLEGVRSVKPVVYRAGIVKNGTDIHGVVFKGMERDSTANPLEVSIPGRLSEIMGLAEGDEMLAYFVGEKVRLRKFRVASVYDGLIDADDRLVVYAGLEDMQRLNGWETDKVSAFEVQAEEKYRDVQNLEALSLEIGYITYRDTAEDGERVVAVSSVSRYPQLFDWLDLIDFNVLFILVLMTIVAGFNMISGLLIMLFEHISTIGLLKALGMTDRSIARIFLTKASSCVLKGMLAGNLLAAVFCLVQGTTHLIRLNPDNYFIGFVPVHIDLWMVILADAAVYMAVMLLLLIPSMFISRVDPAESVTMR